MPFTNSAISPEFEENESSALARCVVKIAVNRYTANALAFTIRGEDTTSSPGVNRIGTDMLP